MLCNRKAWFLLMPQRFSLKHVQFPRCREQDNGDRRCSTLSWLFGKKSLLDVKTASSNPQGGVRGNMITSAAAGKWARRSTNKRTWFVAVPDMYQDVLEAAITVIQAVITVSFVSGSSDKMLKLPSTIRLMFLLRGW